MECKPCGCSLDRAHRTIATTALNYIQLRLMSAINCPTFTSQHSECPSKSFRNKSILPSQTCGCVRAKYEENPKLWRVCCSYVLLCSTQNRRRQANRESGSQRMPPTGNTVKTSQVFAVENPHLPSLCLSHQASFPADYHPQDSASM